jgi:hypothetical protein
MKLAFSTEQERQPCAAAATPQEEKSTQEEIHRPDRPALGTAVVPALGAFVASQEGIS